MSARLLKRELRRRVQQLLKNLTAEEIAEESNRCAANLFQLPLFAQSRNVSVYLSMPSGELQTNSIIDNCFGLGKRVFVPFVEGPVMHMVETPSLADLNAFKPNSWGIPEPPSIDGRAKVCEDVSLDLIVVPGVAFDRKMNRIGHGKGYYDHFIQKCHDHANEKGARAPTLVALALKDQLLEEGKIPMTETDWKMDYIICDGEIISNKS